MVQFNRSVMSIGRQVQRPATDCARIHVYIVSC